MVPINIFQRCVTSHRLWHMPFSLPRRTQTTWYYNKCRQLIVIPSSSRYMKHTLTFLIYEEHASIPFNYLFDFYLHICLPISLLYDIIWVTLSEAFSETFSDALLEKKIIGWNHMATDRSPSAMKYYFLILITLAKLRRDQLKKLRKIG